MSDTFNLYRAMTHDGSARLVVIDSKEILNKAISYHHMSPTASAALGRLLTAGSMLGSLMGEQQETLTLRINGEGPAGTVIVVADANGNVRGYIENPQADLPLKPNGQPNVGALIGEGTLAVIRDSGVGEPHTGLIALTSGEIAEDIAAFYAESEQIPTVCALGTVIEPYGSCRVSGGILIQLLPFPDDATVAKIERNLSLISNVSKLFDEGKTVEEIAAIAMTDIPYDPFDMLDTRYVCTCSRSRMLRGIRSLGKEQVKKLLDEQEAEGKPRMLEACCRFCGSRYEFTEKELLR